MKNVLLSIFAFALSTTASAQFVLVDDELPVLASDVDKITYEENDRFSELLLPACLANNPKTTIFSQALQLTGLADTLQAWNYDNYHRDEEKCLYKFASESKYLSPRRKAWFNEYRFRMFNVFVETDSVYAAKGIHNLEQLKAYAKQVYDEVFPEDVSVNDPTDRRNSLNRFVSYHILGNGCSNKFLTVCNGKKYDAFWLDTDMADMSAWYATLMPHAALKCSYPMGDNSGLYINRRGVQNGPDKYGKQVRGAKILADGEQGLDHKCFNGYYFYVDDILAYDRITREEVLGSELWRVDFKTLSPDIMNDVDMICGDFDPYDSMGGVPDEYHDPGIGWDHVYKWDCMEHIKGDITKDSQGLVATRARMYYCYWQGDAAFAIGDYDMTIKLPPLPAGEWEVRLGTYVEYVNSVARIYLNGEIVMDSLHMSKATIDELSAQSKCIRGPRECVFGYKYRLSDDVSSVRYPLGRIKSDGKSDNYLRIVNLTEASDNTSDAMFDYFEFVPKFVYDNQEIPEE